MRFTNWGRALPPCSAVMSSLASSSVQVLSTSFRPIQVSRAWSTVQVGLIFFVAMWASFHSERDGSTQWKASKGPPLRGSVLTFVGGLLGALGRLLDLFRRDVGEVDRLLGLLVPLLQDVEQ